MVLLSYKHLILTKKSILVGLLSLCIVVTGCDKKSERRRSGKKADGGTELVTKTDPKQDGQPCIPPQPNTPVPPGQNNNNPANGQNPQVAATTMNPDAQKPTVPNGPVPCVPGQTSPNPGEPGSVNNGSTATPNNDSQAPTQPGVLIPSQSADKNNADKTNQSPAGTDGSRTQTHSHSLPNLDLKGSDKADDSVAHDDEDKTDEDDDSKTDDKNEKSKYTKDIKQLLKILDELDIFYKNAMWTITRDKYNTPKNFFESLGNRLAKRVNTKNLLINVDGKYIEESRDHSCTGQAFELQVNTDKSLQKLFVYNCDREMVEDESSPVLVFRKNRKGWNLATSIQGLRQVIDDKSLGFLLTIPNNENVSRIVMRPKCEIILDDEDQKEIKIQSAICKYWGQQFMSHDNKNETYLFEEFKYDADDTKLFSVKARSIDLDNESNQLCYKNQIDALAEKSGSEIDITDGHDDKGVACSIANKDLAKNGTKAPQTQNLVAVPPQVPAPAVAPTTTESQQLVPQTLHSAPNQQANTFNQVNPMNQPTLPNVDQDQAYEFNQTADMANVNPGYETDPNAVNPNVEAPAFDPNANQAVMVDENGEEIINTTVEVNPTQAPPVVYRQERQNQKSIIREQRHRNTVPSVNSYDGQQMDFSSEAPPRSH